MKFNTIDDAKEYVISRTNRMGSVEDVDSVIGHYKEMIAGSNDQVSKGVWLSRVDELNEWKASDDFKSGNFPQGIDDLVIELIEWRSVIYAFQNVDTQRRPFEESGFYTQWYLGGVYGIFSIFGKLLSKDSRDNSLRKLWKEISPIMLDEGSCTQLEVDFINEALDTKSGGRFTNEKSQALLFRNKLISHNEAMPIVRWSEVDKDFAFLIRMWSLLVSWSSYGLFQPFRTDDQAFLGVESMFNCLEISKLKAKRQEYLAMAEKWSNSFVHTGEVDPGRGVFSTLSIRVSLVS